MFGPHTIRVIIYSREGLKRNPVNTVMARSGELGVDRVIDITPTYTSDGKFDAETQEVFDEAIKAEFVRIVRV